MNRPAPVLEVILYPVAALFRALVVVRNRAFDRGWRQGQNIGTAVLSVGNITSGGTGKTPIVSMLVDGLKAQGRIVGIVSRGYGGTEGGPAVLPSDGTRETAASFGDEPTWLAARHPDVPVAICANRVAAARELSRTRHIDTIIADDAFQHRQLFRAFDVVVLDASEPEWHYRALPLGRMREPFKSLARASAVFITKTNLVDASATVSLRNRILSSVENPPPIFEFESHIQGMVSITASPSIPSTVSPGVSGGVPAVEMAKLFGEKGIFLVSGIGNPSTFSRLVESDVGVSVKGHAIFKDHYSYSEEDKARIARDARAVGAEDVLVTEKDAVKLGGLWPPDIKVWVTRLEMRPRADLKELYEAIDRALL